MGCKTSKGYFFFLSRVLSPPPPPPHFFFCFIDLKLTPSSYLFFFLNLFACRMTIGHEEVSTSQVGRIRGTPWETLIISYVVAAMFEEELRLYNQIPTEISLETSDGATTTTVGEAYNVVYFTRE